MNLAQIILNLQNYNLVHNLQNLDENQINDIVIESKNAKPNSIFFGLIGSKNDGANFVPQVANLGCKVAVIDKRTGNFVTKLFEPDATDDVMGFLPAEEVVRIANYFVMKNVSKLN